MDEIPLERLETEITSWSGNLAAATAQLLGWIADYDEREGWRTWGARSCAEWLSWKCGDSLHTAREKVRVARALQALPVAASAFSAGELSYSKVRAITRVACGEDDADWVEQARHATGAQLDRLVSAVIRSLDEDDPRGALERRRCVRGDGNRGTGTLRIEAPRDMIDTIAAAVEVVATRIIDEAVSGSDRRRTEVIAERGGLAAVRVDALLQIAEQALAAAPAAAERGDVGRLSLVVDTETLSAIADEPSDGVCTLGGQAVDPEIARRWACDIRSSVVIDHEGHGCDEGRETRVLNRRLRRALLRRDHGSCRFPGCGVNSWLHAHHIIHWADHGPTELANLVSLCGFHHRLVHEGGWTVELTAGGVAWRDPDGESLITPPLAGSASDIPPTSTAPAAGRWHRDGLDFHFAVAVVTEHCLRARARAGVPAGTSASTPRHTDRTRKERRSLSRDQRPE
ncbi:MAG: DUF222 domain-containing protein [Acidimicrobiales bacterium]|nr:DUF222 domain-containing protein [Acidimicrobiales bacterium]